MAVSWLVPLFLVIGTAAVSCKTWEPDKQLLAVATQDKQQCAVEITPPLDTNVVLTSVQFTFKVTLPPFILNDEATPMEVYYRLWSEGGLVDNETGSLSRVDMSGPTYSFDVATTLHSSGHQDVFFNFSKYADFSEDLCHGQEFTITLFAIPGPLTLLPPLLTAVIAIVFRQVIIALLVGIWMCCFFAYKYNPLTASLRTVDKYFVESVADFEHSQIAVFSFFLGGLIGVVQKSGGGLGLAALLKKLTGSRRKASIACILLGGMIFFDDYSLVLIAGTSLRTMMATANISKEKFAYILKSLGPTLPSLVPISSWIGVQVGNLQMALNSRFCKSCNLDVDPFVMTVSTIPYRFFPLLLLFTVLLIAVFNRDFGPLLTAERKAMPKEESPILPPALINTRMPEGKGAGGGGGGMGEKLCPNGGKLCPNGGTESGVGSDSDTERVELRRTLGSEPSLATLMVEEIPGPLAPKKGVKYRWFNAAIPFLVTMVITLLGMVLDGWDKIRSMPEDERLPMTVINIFTKADSVAALIWASALACVVAMAMLLLQRILTLEEYMNSWVEGVKDIIEPYMVLWLAWALGAAIQDIQTTNFLAKALSDGGLDAKYIPAIVTVIGFLMSFAAGSAFGTMGIIFPLVVPTVCQISNCNKDDIVQSSAAILSSSIFGNVISPIAGICILTVFASQCPLERHIKSAALYVLIIAAVSVVFGSLPVGAGWYPWYEGWIVMATIMVIIFVLFSSDTDSPKSQPLMQRLFPKLYSVPAGWFASDKVDMMKRRCHLMVCSCCNRGKKSPEVSSDLSDLSERTELLS